MAAPVKPFSYLLYHCDYSFATPDLASRPCPHPLAVWRPAVTVGYNGPQEQWRSLPPRNRRGLVAAHPVWISGCSKGVYAR
ncbi:hypothetical protein [Thermogemmatispora carboxidivorans]|uniref:hypothetical protein n=1 Tax=Thermogemmatispora carboxidivorans TaxID=1382306 RepID=UPI00069ACF90|nr:hypothetical protein [Thermogemmatispora carboxidivorans]